MSRMSQPPKSCICECCGQAIPSGLRPPDSTGNGTDGWRISTSPGFSHWVYREPDGRFYETRIWGNMGSARQSCEWIEDAEANRLIRKSIPVEWNKE